MKTATTVTTKMADREAKEEEEEEEEEAEEEGGRPEEKEEEEEELKNLKALKNISRVNRLYKPAFSTPAVGCGGAGMAPTPAHTLATPAPLVLAPPPPPTLVYGRIILGEVTPLLAAIRRTGSQRWSGQDPADLHHHHHHHHLTLPLVDLQRRLMTLTPPDPPLPPLVYLEPFLAIIKAEDTSGPVTRGALNAVNRMISYGLLNPRDGSAGSLRESAEAAEAVAAAVSRARFIGTESASDEVVLYSIVWLLSSLVLCAAGPLLTNAAVCEILNSAFRICFENRLSDLLRACTEEALRQMVTLIFTRLPLYPPHDAPQAPSSTPCHHKVKLRSGKVTAKSGPATVNGSGDTRSRRQVTSVARPEMATAESGVVAAGVVTAGVRGMAAVAGRPSTPAGGVEAAGGGLPSPQEPPRGETSEEFTMEAAGDGQNTVEKIYDTAAVASPGGSGGAAAGGGSGGGLPAGSEGQTAAVAPQTPPQTVQTSDQFTNAQGVTFTANATQGEVSAFHTAHGDPNTLPFGIPCVREVLSFLISLTTPTNDQNTVKMIQTALNLLTVALEIGSNTIGEVPCLVSLLSDHLCKHLLQILTRLDAHRSYGVYTSALRLFACLCESFRSHIKFQIEVIHTRILALVTSEQAEVTYTHKEYAIQTLLHVWCLDGFPSELYINFDCDVFSANCFEDTVKSISKQVFPLEGVFGNNLLCLDLLLLLMESLDTSGDKTEAGKEDAGLPNASTEKQTQPSGKWSACGTTEVSAIHTYALAPRLLTRTRLRDGRQMDIQTLTKRKRQKNMIATATELFNAKPEKGVAYLIETGILGKKTRPGIQTADAGIQTPGKPEPLSVAKEETDLEKKKREKPEQTQRSQTEAEEIAVFLRHNPKLCKKALGNYLSAKKNVDILNAFVATFDFKNLRVDEALRLFLESFRLPGEAPLISLVLETFASHWFESNAKTNTVDVQTDARNDPEADPVCVAPGEGSVDEANTADPSVPELPNTVGSIPHTAETNEVEADPTIPPVLPNGSESADSNTENEDPNTLTGDPNGTSPKPNANGRMKSTVTDPNAGPPKPSVAPYNPNVLSSDAAFTLAYAVIMLNVDQHNKNARKQNVPMTADQFKANLRGVNDGQNFDPFVLAEIYQAVKSEEFVMPSEQTGVIRDEYEWKLVLKRGRVEQTEPYVLANGGREVDQQLFACAWGPTVAALSYVFDKTTNESVIKTSLAGYKRIASIAFRFNMSDVFDNLIVTLCKFTSVTGHSEGIAAVFAGSIRARLSTRCVVDLIVAYGDAVRDGWKNVIEVIVRLFKARLLPGSLTDGHDFLDPSGKVSLQPSPPLSAPHRADSSLFSSLYSYIALGETHTRTQPDTETVMCARDCVRACRPERIIHESVYLRTHTLIEFTHTLLSDAYTGQEDAHTHTHTQAFLLELCVRVLTANKDRAHKLWPHVRKSVYAAFVCARRGERVYLLERTCVCVLRCTQVLLRRPSDGWSRTVKWLLTIRPKLMARVSRQILFGLKEVLTANTVHIQAEEDWDIIFRLVEFAGAGALPPPHYLLGGAEEEEEGGGGGESDGTIDSGVGSDDLPQPPPPPHQPEEPAGSSGSRQPSPPPPQQPPRQPQSLDSTGGGWILVGREGEVEQQTQNQLTTTTTTTITTATTTTTPYTLVPATTPSRRHRPENLLAAVSTLSFLAKDCLPATGGGGEPPAAAPPATILALGSATRATRTLVEAALHGGLINQQLAEGRGKQPNNNNSHKKKKKRKRKKPAPPTTATTTSPPTPPTTPPPPPPAHYSSYSSDNDNPEASDDDDGGSSGGGGGGRSDGGGPDSTQNHQLIYQQVSEKLLDLMGCLHTSASQISTHYQNQTATTTTTTTTTTTPGTTVDLWNVALCPLLQGIARFCCDSRGNIRSVALTTLQRALLTHDLVLLTAHKWEELFHRVLFPLLNGLIDLQLLLQLPLPPHQQQLQPHQHLQLQQLEEARLRAATLVMKVYLRHLSPLLTLPTFTALWLTILDFLDKYLSVSNDHLREAIPEMLKNMLLVMQTTQVFQTTEGFTKLWCITWDRIDAFLPTLRHNVFRSHPPSEIQSPDLASAAETPAAAAAEEVEEEQEEKKEEEEEEEEEEEQQEEYTPPSLGEQEAARLSLSQENLPEIIEHSGIILQPPLPAPLVSNSMSQSEASMGERGRSYQPDSQSALPIILQGLPLFTTEKKN